MTREELKMQLFYLGFNRDVSHEYHNEVFENMNYDFGGKSLFIEAYIDRYNLRVVWYYAQGKKAGKNYYMSIDVADSSSARTLIDSFISYCIENYRIAI